MSGGDFKAEDLRPKSEGSMQGGFPAPKVVRLVSDD